jgi:type 1 glutamine amidotransferase
MPGRTRLIALAGLVALASCRSTKLDPGTGTCTLDAAPAGSRLLVFSRTAGYRHESIPPAVDAIRAIGTRQAIAVEHTEDAGAFTDGNLGRFAAVVFLSTTGDVLDAAQQAAFERFIRSGGGFVGVHSASDTEYDWPWYGQLVGAYFSHHTAIEPATVRVEAGHLSTRCLPATWARTDEWYDFRARPPADVSVHATVESGEPHPITWSRRFDGGRSWYTAMGHTTESYSDPTFLDHLAGGILWAVSRQ